MLLVKSSNLETVCGVTSALPHHHLPEIALAGRSNVGKSTLINVLINRKNYAHTSSRPGKTQTINYYNINNSFYLVDLPGYGYASPGLEARQQWGKMIDRYLMSSSSLKQIFLILDIRRVPNDDDVLMFEWIVQKGFTPIVIATKIDKVKKSSVTPSLDMIHKTLREKSSTGNDVEFDIIPFSGLSKQGRDDVLKKIEMVLKS